MTTTVMLKMVRLSFPDLFEPREFEKGDGKARFSETLLIEPGSDNDNAIRAAITEECKAKFGSKWEARMKALMGDSGKCCYRDGNGMNNEHFADHTILAAHRQEKNGAPKVIDKDKSPLDAKAGRPYSGCYVNTKVEFYVQTGDYPGIRCSPLVVQFAKDGDAFAGRPVSDKDAEEFEDLSEGADAADEDEFDENKF